ncbi:MAG: hypothetical protein LBQ84_03595 [Flavobacteriaceae bacterium]|jgi:hypothetical protein|nr:hypothetical protein [Flavobacteriaceae bacterium]
MESGTLHNNLLKSIEEQIPERGNLANIFMDKLDIGKEAAYRRLRGEIPFTLHEAVTMARELNISLDHVWNISSDDNNLFQFNFVEYIGSTEPEYTMIEQFIDILRFTKNDSFSEVGSIENVFTFALFLNYEYITRFSLFKWQYQYGKTDEARCYNEIKIPEKLSKIYNDIITESKNIRKTHYIWDHMIFTYLVNDIKYFTKKRLISKKNRQQLKEELLVFIDDLESLTTKGHFDNGNEVYFYISNINFSSTYSYVQTKNYGMTLISAFTLNSVTSLNPKVLEKMKRWIESVKNTSTLISKTGEMQRILFFKKQRELINTL